VLKLQYGVIYVSKYGCQLQSLIDSSANVTDISSKEEEAGKVGEVQKKRRLRQGMEQKGRQD